VQLGARENPNGLGRTVNGQAEGAVGRKGVDELAEVEQSLAVEPFEQLGQLGLAPGGLADKSNQRRSAAEGFVAGYWSRPAADGVAYSLVVSMTKPRPLPSRSQSGATRTTVAQQECTATI
jgi:hypothetical protein